MKSFGLTIMALFAIVLPLAAQTAPPAVAPAAPAPNTERLDQLLKGWEERMSSLESFSTRTERTDVHPLTKKSTKFVGEAAFMKPNLARIDLTHQDEVGKPDPQKTNFERYFCDGNYIYEYLSKEKLIVIHDLPKNNAAEDNMILSFLRGMKAAAAKQRFDISVSKESEWYAYLLISPKTTADKQEFSVAQLTIWLKNPNPQGQPNLMMMPCRLWYKQPNGKEVTYMFSDTQPNGAVGKDTFVPRQIEGYKTEKAAAPAPKPGPTVRP